MAAALYNARTGRTWLLHPRSAPQFTASIVKVEIMGTALREAEAAGTGLTPVFPLWHRPTAELSREILAQGIRAVITCVDPSQAPKAIAGRPYDQALLATLPASVDPCGENGEFHTFVTDAPGFAHPLEVTTGETAERNGFLFTDLLPRAARSANT